VVVNVQQGKPDGFHELLRQCWRKRHERCGGGLGPQRVESVAVLRYQLEGLGDCLVSV
jgi:hypothetical protein